MLRPDWLLGGMAEKDAWDHHILDSFGTKEKLLDLHETDEFGTQITDFIHDQPPSSIYLYQ